MHAMKIPFHIRYRGFRFMFGLRWVRMAQWAKDVWREKPGVGELYMMTRMAIRAMLSPIPKHLYLERLTVCSRCDVYNHAMKSCRKGERGCGCYVPYKALARVQCWKEEQNANTGWGVIKN